MTLGTSPPRAADGSRAGRAPTVPEPAAIYRERRERFGRERDRLTARWNLVANLRLLAFVAAAACLGWGVWRRAPWLGPPAALLCGAFVALVVHHGRLGRARRRFDELWRINDEAGKRLARDWDALPVRHTARAAPDHPYAADLDLFGRASLAHLLETVATGPGEATLAAWLAAPAPVGMVRERQGRSPSWRRCSTCATSCRCAAGWPATPGPTRSRS